MLVSTSNAMQLSPDKITLIETMHNIVASHCTGCRSHNKADGNTISINGIGAEYAAMHLLGGRQSIRAWAAQVLSGTGVCGKDILRQWVGVQKDIEIKSTTASLTPDYGFLFLRTIRNSLVSPFHEYYSGDQQPPLSYWDAYLPDSYFVFVKQSNSYHYEIIGFATKYDLLSHYEQSETIREKINPPRTGYPIIGLHHSQLRPIEDMI